MAATDPSPNTPAKGDDTPRPGVGMAHLTVVPENFDSIERDEFAE